MEALRAFVPIDRRIALVAGRDLSDSTAGAALFADIAGFTPLTDALAQELGPQRGAEELTAHLNRVFGQLVQAVHEQRGSVVSFGGDAIMCWFDQDDGLRAATSATSMQAALAEHGVVETPAGSRFELGLKVAIATGPTRRFVVGDPRLKLLDVIAGRTLETIAAVERQAISGEVLVSEPTARNLGGKVHLGPWRENAAGLKSAPIAGLLQPAPIAPWSMDEPALAEADRLAERWIWPSVRERLTLGGRFLAELRPVVALYVSFEGIDYDKDAASGEHLDHFVRTFERLLDKHGGTLLEVSIGDKGSSANAAFGTPQALADDASRAVAASLELMQVCREELPWLTLRIGLARGPMRTGAYGSQHRASYTVMGDRMNLGARLMVAARDGSLLCDDAVADRASRHWIFESLPPLRVKGKTESVAVFRPTGERARTAAPRDSALQPLVGRRIELAQLVKSVEDARSGAQRAVALSGDGGIGKSRLVAAVFEHLDAQGLFYSLGSGQSIERHTPYRAWRDVLFDGFRLNRFGTPAARRRKVESWVETNAPSLRERAPLLDDILGLGWSDSPLTAGLEPDLRRESLVDLVLAILREWGQAQPCVLVFDDAQWLDDLSWALVQDVCRGLRASDTPMLLLLSMRFQEPGDRRQDHLDAIEALGILRRVQLKGLSPDSTARLAAQRLGVAPEGLPEDLKELLDERAAGNPFIAQEIVLALRDRGVLRNVPIEDDELDALSNYELTVGKDEALADLPTDVKDLVLARIDRLPAVSQLVLKTASVIGRRFGLDLLVHAVDKDDSAARPFIEQALVDLQSHELALLESSSPRPVYAFNHIITQETAYSTLLFEQRRGIHRAVASWYELQYGEGDKPPPEEGLKTLEPYYALLSHHYRHSEDLPRERVYVTLAGEHAATQFANDDALRFLDRGLAITDDSNQAQQFRLMSARETVLDRVGQRELQAEAVEALERLAATANRSTWEVESGIRRANLAVAMSDYSAALSAVDAIILSSSQDRQLGEAALRSQILKGRILWLQGDFADAEGVLENAQATAAAVGDTARVADCLLNLGAIRRHQLRHDHARRDFENAVAIFRHMGNQYGEAGCLSTLAAIAGERGEFTESLRFSSQAEAIWRDIGYRRGLSIVEGNVAADLFDLGDYVEAKSRLEEVSLLCRELGDRWGEAVCLDTLGLTLLRLKEVQPARQLLVTAVEIQTAIDDQLGLGYTLGHLGDALLEVGDLEGSSLAHRDAIDLRERLEQDALAIDNRSGLARVALARNDLGTAQGIVLQIRDWIHEHGTEGIEFPVWVLWTCWRVLAATGEDVAARDALRQAHEMVQERAAGIQDARLKTSFLENVPYNRDVLADWAKLEAG